MGLNLPYQVLLGDALNRLRTLPTGWFHICVTSPPYWLLRNYGVKGQIGQEDTWDHFLQRLLDVFAEVKRVLRNDGTLWVNMGDGYVQQGKSRSDAGDTRSRAAKSGSYHTDAFSRVQGWSRATGSANGILLRPKQLMGQPWRLAFALQESGWWLRSDIVWDKPNAIPKSVKDRPGLDHEYIFLLSPSSRYYYDREAWTNGTSYARTVWDIPICSRGNKGHYATFPRDIAKRCILLGSSAKGCCSKCGAPRSRLVEPTPEYAVCLGKSWHDHKEDGRRGQRAGKPCRKFNGKKYQTTGWKDTCDCHAATVPCRVLDPFSGSGTTGVVALQNGRHYTGIELKPEYHSLSLEALKATVTSVPVTERQSGQLSLLDQLEMEIV